MQYDHVPALKKWHDTVVGYYGSLEQFPDRPSIEIQLDHTERMIGSIKHFLDTMGELKHDCDLSPWVRDLAFLLPLQRRLRLRLGKPIEVTAEELVESMRQGHRWRPKGWTDGWCEIVGQHIFAEKTPRTVGVETSPAIAGAQDAIRKYGNQWSRL